MNNGLRRVVLIVALLNSAYFGVGFGVALAVILLIPDLATF